MKVAVSGAVGLRECMDSLHCISKQKNEQIIMVARITHAVQCKYMYACIKTTLKRYLRQTLLLPFLK